jgi:hypothetical protein
MAPLIKRGWSFAQDRRLIELAASSKSLEAVAKLFGRKPEAVARSARRLGVSLKPQAALEAKRK